MPACYPMAPSPCEHPHMATNQTSPAFRRDPLTWLVYLLLACYAFVQAGLGPAMPFLRDEFRLSYTVGGLHPSALAAGTVVMGVVADRIIRRWGRQRSMWGGALGIALGALLLVLGRAIWVTLPATLLMGLAGSLVLVLIQSVLADHHGPHRTIALTESNIAASASATLAPLAIGTLAASGAGWRAAFLLGVGALAWWGWRARHVSVPSAPAPSEARAGGGSLPPHFWAFWAVIVLAVAAEWSVILWSADFLEQVGGLPRNQAALWVSSFFLAAVGGRVVGSLLARRAPSEPLLLLAFAIAGIGFLLFWQAPAPAARVVGLFLSGLGIANLFPLTLSLALGLAPAQSDQASARITLGGGLAILLAPLLLGRLADMWGLAQAFAIVPVLLGGGALLVGLAMRPAALRPHPVIPTTQETCP